MSVRTAVTSVALLAVLAGSLAGCTQTVEGTPGPRPTVGQGGDFPSGTPTDDTTSDTPTDEPTDSSSSDTPTDEPTGDPTGEPTGVPTDVTTTNPDSVETLCANLAYAGAQTGVGASTIKTFVSTVILAWGIANSDSDPYAKADDATTSACPETRTKILGIMGLPDLASTED